jgi:hypothetical protein
MKRSRSAGMALDLNTLKAVTRANREQCAELVDFIHRKRADLPESFFEIGEALRTINKKALYRAAGHDSFADLLRAHGLPSLTQANKLVAVVELLERADAVALGQEKAYALTRYVQAVGTGTPIHSLLKQRDVVDGKSVQEATVRDLLDAARRAKAERRPPSALQDRKQAAARMAQRAQASLRKQGWEDVQVKARRVGGRFEFDVVTTEELLRRLARL